jgi:hypothetical protein
MQIRTGGIAADDHRYGPLPALSLFQRLHHRADMIMKAALGDKPAAANTDRPAPMAPRKRPDQA